MMYEDFDKKNCRGGGAKYPNSFRKLRLFLKIKIFERSLIVLESACKIRKSLKNGKLV